MTLQHFSLTLGLFYKTEMELSPSLFISMQFPLKLSLLHLALITFFFSISQPLCHDEEIIALLQFKDSFVIDNTASYEPFAYPKTASWAQEKNHDCCSWDGVECDEETGHVIALHLNSSCLYGSINSSSSLFHLSQLQLLNLADNYFSESQIPSALGNLSRLTYLNLSWSGFSGLIPSSIGKLTWLTYLQLSRNKLSGQIPYALGNLSRLTHLGLGGCFNNMLTGSVYPPSICKQTRPTHLHLSRNHYLNGQIPSSFRNLTKLVYLLIGINNLTSQIPPWLGNLTQLAFLSLADNNLFGTVPRSFSRLKNLQLLRLNKNQLSGTLDFDMFLGMKNLVVLQLSYNKLSLLITETKNSTNGTCTTPQFYDLELDSCNLTNFPGFLRYQNNLTFLTLRQNQIHGHVPKWILNMSVETLEFLDLSQNFLTGFDQPSTVHLPWVRLKILSLYNNMLKGALPLPPTSILSSDVSNNKLSGEIAPSFCNLSSIQYLNLGGNKLSGMLPECLKNLSDSLLFLNLVNNSLHGTIPEICTNGSQLRMIDLSYNKFEGSLPRSLGSCLRLQSLNLGNNQLEDVFPFWLGTLPDLRVLMLRSNQLHGMIGKPISNAEFPNIQVIDLSYNDFTGMLPSEYFQIWNSMKSSYASNVSYLGANSNFNAARSPNGLAPSWIQGYNFSIKITVKGVERRFGILDDLNVIDFSSNRFQGEIPESIGSLQGIRVLNLSNNILTGIVPSTLGDITVLESLDLSQNSFQGEIPHQLKQLTFLSFFNVSHNNLTGPIPEGNQFATFERSSYDGNLGLCGYPLEIGCGNSEAPTLPPPASEEKGDSWFSFEFDWITILPGYVSGLVVGIVAGNIVFVKKRFWFMEILHLWQMKRRSSVRRRRRRRRGLRG